MNLSQISPGPNPPQEIHVVIEIPMNSGNVKYEIDKKSGALFVDRMIRTPMHYPCHYGFIPGTFSPDGDPIDVLMMTEEELIPGCVILARPVAVLLMEDESGQDEKILAVPVSSVTPAYEKVQNLKDLCPLKQSQITHFFEHYKDLEPSKWVKITGWEDRESAHKLIQEAINRAVSY